MSTKHKLIDTILYGPFFSRANSRYNSPSYAGLTCLDVFVGVETWLDDKRGGVLENCGGKNRFGGLPGRLKLSFCSELNSSPVTIYSNNFLGKS